MWSSVWWSKAVFVFSSRPQEVETPCPCRAQTGKLCTLISSPERNGLPCVHSVYMCVFPGWCHAHCCFIVFISVLILILFFPPFFTGAVGSYLELTLMCSVTLLQLEVGPWITRLCIVSVYTLFLIIILLPSHQIQSKVHWVRFHLCWGGVVVYYSWLVWSEVRVIWHKYNKMEYWWGDDEHRERETQGSFSFHSSSHWW